MIAYQPDPAYQPAVGYLRRSTDRQEQSIGDQRAAIERYAAEHGYDLLDFYVDDAISGTTADERKAFLRLMADARAAGCPFRYVLVYDIKRFGRLDNDEAGHYRYQLRQAGVEVVYVSEGFNGDDTDDLLRPVKQWQARQESKDLSKVTIRGLVSRGSGGWWNGGTPPYGYDLAYFNSAGEFLLTLRFESDCTKAVLDEAGQVTRRVPKGERLTFTKQDRCRLVLSDPARVEVVRNIFHWYVHEGLGFKAIAERLNRQGVPSPRGGAWSARHADGWAMTTVRDMLVNPVYTGDLVWNRLTFAKFHRIQDGHAVAKRGLPKGKTGEQNRPEDWLTSRDAHPAIIERAEFEIAKSLREERKAALNRDNYRRGRGATSRFLLSGLLHCLRCGCHWQGYTTTKGRKRTDGTAVKTYYYACNGYIAKGPSTCERSVIPQEEIEAWVFEQIGDIIEGYLQEGGEAKLRAMIEEALALGTAEVGTTVGQLKQRRRDIEATVNNLLDNLTPTNRDFVDRRIESLRGELADLDRQELALSEQRDAQEQARRLAEAAFAVARDFRRLVAEGTIDEQRTLIRAFLHRLDLDPETGEGTGYFWLVPGAGARDFHPSGGLSSFHSESPAPATYRKEEDAPESASSFTMVAGAGFEPATFGL